MDGAHQVQFFTGIQALLRERDLGEIAHARRGFVQARIGFERQVVHVKRRRELFLLLIYLAKMIAHQSFLAELPGWGEVTLGPRQIVHLEVDPAESIPVCGDRPG